MTPEERIEYLVGEVNRLNNFIAERDQKIEMLYEEKASLMDEVKSLKNKNAALDKLLHETWERGKLMHEEMTTKDMEIIVLKSHLDKLTKEILG